ncbi:MAG TPA: hypothetical protein VNK52_04490 [Hyphomicrobiaceae bacterium]|nr:hypothetical protein [Hyphomicrobiaceae bacterium]
MARTGRTEQTNLKFKPEFKKRLLALSSAAGMSMTEYIEHLVNTHGGDAT